MTPSALTTTSVLLDTLLPAEPAAVEQIYRTVGWALERADRHCAGVAGPVGLLAAGVTAYAIRHGGLPVRVVVRSALETLWRVEVSGPDVPVPVPTDPGPRSLLGTVVQFASYPRAWGSHRVDGIPLVWADLETADDAPHKSYRPLRTGVSAVLETIRTQKLPLIRAAAQSSAPPLFADDGDFVGILRPRGRRRPREAVLVGSSRSPYGPMGRIGWSPLELDEIPAARLTELARDAALLPGGRMVEVPVGRRAPSWVQRLTRDHTVLHRVHLALPHAEPRWAGAIRADRPADGGHHMPQSSCDGLLVLMALGSVPAGALTFAQAPLLTGLREHTLIAPALPAGHGLIFDRRIAGYWDVTPGSNWTALVCLYE